MYKIIVFLSLIILFSCNNKGKTNSNLQTDTVTADNESGNKKSSTKEKTDVTFQSENPDEFDWNKTTILKQKFIQSVKNEMEANDILLVEFLEEYKQIVYEFENVFPALVDVLALESMLMDKVKEIEPHVKEFKKKAESNGFNFAISEGGVYIQQSTKYLKSGVINLLDSVSSEYLILYCKEIDKKCCEDGGIVISGDEMAQRAYDWGELCRKATGKQYESTVKKEFYSYLFLLYAGLDNTPAFDPQSRKFDRENYEIMMNTVSQHPDSKVTEEFKIYAQLLKEQRFIETEEVGEYLSTIASQSQ